MPILTLIKYDAQIIFDNNENILIQFTKNICEVCFLIINSYH